MFSRLTLPVKRIVSEARCRWWDWQHGVDTCGDESLHVEHVSPSARESFSQAQFYMPTHPKLVYRILNLLNPQPGRYDFVDFGSGKGRVLLIASEFPLHQVIGVEFDQRLHAIAQENIRQFEGPRKCHQVQSICVDAATYKPPAHDTIFFFFFPFKHKVMELVLTHIRESIERGAHDCFVVYVNPELGDMVDQTGIFDPYYEDQYCRIWRARTGAREHFVDDGAEGPDVRAPVFSGRT
jgi:SAM-dependent methyltransferase